MKLVDILARELKVWPELSLAATQDDDGDINHQLSPGTPEFSEVLNIWKRIPGELQIFGNTGIPLSDDYKTAIVTRAEWQAAVDAMNAPKVVEWDEVGLPPVGLDVEIKRGNCTWIDGDEWQIGKTATVMASFLNSRDIEMASVQFPGGHCECILARCLSPIRTAEQVAAEEREKGIQEICATLGWLNIRSDGSAQEAAILYDAGYRKQVAK